MQDMTALLHQLCLVPKVLCPDIMLLLLMLWYLVGYRQQGHH